MCSLVAGATALSPIGASGEGVEAHGTTLLRLAGSYRYAGDSEEAKATIRASIETAVSNLGWLGRRVAANRLSNHKELPDRIQISQTGADISVIMGAYSAVAPANGAERELIGPNGRPSKLSYRVTSAELQQYFVFEHAKRKSTYRFNDEGQLVMSVKMTSEKLAAPIEYELVYVRDGS